MKRKLTRFFWGLVLVPFTCATLYHLPDALVSLGSRFKSVLLLIGGAILYIMFETLFSRPMRTYVFGHELTHALTAVAMGGKVFSFRFSKKGGSVSLSKTNFLVALAPYCFPIYTSFVLLLYFVIGFFYPVEKMHTVLLVLVGLTMAFHGSLTIFAVRQEQPDIHKTGVFFSLVFILLVNSWVLVLISKALFSDVISLQNYFLDTMSTQFQIWKWVGGKALLAFEWAREGLAGAIL